MIVRLAVVLAVVVTAVLVGRWWQSRQGRIRPVAESGGTGDVRIVAATLVSTPTCRTCPQVRHALEIVAGADDEFTWEEVDAAADPAFVRSHDVMRAPTVLFHDAQGRVVTRAAGAMGPSQVADAAGIDLVTVARGHPRQRV